MLTVTVQDDERLPDVQVRWRDGGSTFEVLHRGRAVASFRSGEAMRRAISPGRAVEIAEDRIIEIANGERELPQLVDEVENPC